MCKQIVSTEDSDANRFFSQLDNDALRILLGRTSLKNAPLIIVSSSLYIEHCNEEAKAVIGLHPLERIEQILSEQAIFALRNCISQKQSNTVLEELDGIIYYLEIMPHREGALLAFMTSNEAAYDGSLRVIHQKSAQYLMGIMSAIHGVSDPKVALELHKQCLRMQRLFNHSDFLHEPWLLEHIPLKNENISELCQEIAEETQKKSGYQITVEAPKEYILLVNRDILTQAIYNLITNAIKASPNNKEISVIVREDSLSPSITISDNGNGLDPMLFDILLNSWKNPVSLENELKLSPYSVSLGLGLPFVQRVAQLHGGQLLLSPKKNGGSELHLILSHLPPILQNLSLENTMPITQGNSLTDIELSVL